MHVDNCYLASSNELWIAVWYTPCMTEPIGDLNGKKVLVIEDDILLSTLLADNLAHLREKGLEVYTTVNAEDGLVKARDVKPDLILLDLILPGMTGFEFLEQLRKEEALTKMPVIVLSNLSDDSDKERAKNLGVIAYLIKANFSLSEIAGAIEDILHGRTITMHSDHEPVIERTSHGNMIFL